MFESCALQLFLPLINDHIMSNGHVIDLNCSSNIFRLNHDIKCCYTIVKAGLVMGEVDCFLVNCYFVSLQSVNCFVS